MRKYKINVMYSLFGLVDDNVGTLCYSLVGKNVNLGSFLTIDVYFFYSVLTPDQALLCNWNEENIQ